MSDTKQNGGAIALLAVIFLLPPIMVVPIILLVALVPPGGCTPLPGSSTSPTSTGPMPPDLVVGAYGADRLENARLIASVAMSRGLGEHGAILGITAAIGESSLQNINYGDYETSGVLNPDGSRTTSIGLFQQQDEWGPAENRMDPAGAAGLFYDALVRVTGWEAMSITLAIHEVQVNLDPNHYARYESSAREIFNAIAPYIGAVPVQCAPTGNGVLALPLDPGYVMSDTYGPRIAPVAGASTWHPAYDLINPGRACGAPIYSISDGTVTVAENSWLGITADSGETAFYLHSPSSSYLVSPGERVTAGQHIAAVGTEPPSSGCHLDLRIDKTGTTNPLVAALAGHDRTGSVGPYVNPALYFETYGLELCDAACLGSYSRGAGA